MGTTPFFGLTTLPSTATGAETNKFCVQDRILIDRVLWEAATGHRHDGSTVGTTTAPTTGDVDVTLLPTEGFLPSNTEIFYRWTNVSSVGLESLTSDVVSLTTPGPLATPDPPTVSKILTGGGCAPGAWVYKVTAWRGAYTYDTVGSTAVVANLLVADGAEQQVVIDLPWDTLDADADGFNIYRQMPNSVEMQYLATATASTWPTTLGLPDPYIDTGGVSPLPGVILINTDRSATGAAIRLEGVAIPGGDSMRLYRSYINDSVWTDTFIAEITSGDPIYDDLGGAAGVGTPPNASFAYSNPGPVSIPDETEGDLPAERISGLIDIVTQTDGDLPSERISGFVDIVTQTDGDLPGDRISGTIPLANLQASLVTAEFSEAGATSTGPVGREWVSPFTAVIVTSVTASLAKGSSPDAADLVFDIEYDDAGTWTVLVPDVTIATATSMEHVDVDVLDFVESARGLRLRANVTQIGGGGNTDTDLVVQVVMVAKHTVPAFDWV